MCGWQITLSKIDVIYLLPIPNKLSTISMHTPSLVKIHWYLLKFSIRNHWMKIWMDRQQTDGQTHGWPMWNYNIPPAQLLKIDEICPTAIPKKISTISMHTPSLVKIHWYLLKFSFRNENMDGRTTDRYGQTHGLPMWNYDIPPAQLSKIDEICPTAIPNQTSTVSMSWVWRKTVSSCDTQHECGNVRLPSITVASPPSG